MSHKKIPPCIFDSNSDTTSGISDTGEYSNSSIPASEVDSLLGETGATNNVEMTGASKEENPEKVEVKNAAIQSTGDDISSLVYSFAKKVVTVGIIYFVGYMGWSVAWLITPVILSVAREQWRSKNETRRNVAKASALANDKEVILARLGDLPAWVSIARSCQGDVSQSHHLCPSSQCQIFSVETCLFIHD